MANLFGFEAKVIVTNPNDIKDPRSTWWCLADAGIAIGSSRSGSLLGLLHRRERDSRIFTNAEIIFDDFGSKDTLLLNNRGQTFVSLSGFLEILSKTELSSDKIDDFQVELVSADFRRDASILDISGVPHKTTRTQWRSVHCEPRPERPWN